MLLGGEENNLSDGEFAGWADAIRRERRETATYHYVNIPFEAKEYDAKRDDPEDNRVVVMIGRFESVLADKSPQRGTARSDDVSRPPDWRHPPAASLRWAHATLQRSVPETQRIADD